MNLEHRELIQGRLRSLLDPPSEEDEEGEAEMEEPIESSQEEDKPKTATSPKDEIKPIRGF